jgi:hypothetical protein
VGTLIVKGRPALAVSGESRPIYSVLLFSTFMHNGVRSSAPMAGLPIRQFPRVRRRLRSRKHDATPTSVRSSGQTSDLGGVMSKEQRRGGRGSDGRLPGGLDLSVVVDLGVEIRAVLHL